MNPEIRKALEDRLEIRLRELVNEPHMVTDDDRESIRLLTSVLTLYQLGRLAYHLENGQTAIIGL